MISRQERLKSCFVKTEGRMSSGNYLIDIAERMEQIDRNAARRDAKEDEADENREVSNGR